MSKINILFKSRKGQIPTQLYYIIPKSFTFPFKSYPFSEDNIQHLLVSPFYFKNFAKDWIFGVDIQIHHQNLKRLVQVKEIQASNTKLFAH